MPRDDFDATTMGDAFTRAGIDPRQHVSYGIVENAIGGTNAVDFSSDMGPLVNVRLQPSNIPVRCRVSSHHGGGGEADYHPFSAGDEVLVAIPGGDERNACVVIGRMNNALDTWPGVVGNQDVTKNAFSVRRTIPNYVWEIQNGWLLVNTTTHAQLSLSMTGDWLMSNGEGDFVSLSSNGIAAQLGNGKASLFMQSSSGQVRINFGSGGFLVLDSSSVFLSTQGTVNWSTSGNFPTGHVLTVEQFLNFMVAFMGVVGGPSTSTTWTPAVDTTEAVRTGLLTTAIPLATADVKALPLLLTAINTGLAVPVVPFVSPGLGVAGFNVG